MNRYSYYSEEKALKAEFTAQLTSFDHILLKLYLKHGFSELCKMLQIDRVWQKKTLFDYLVFEKKAVLECIKANKRFFLDLIGNGQGSVIRHVLGIQFCKYNKVWQEAVEFLHQLYMRKAIEDKLFQLASQSFFHLDERLKRYRNLN